MTEPLIKGLEAFAEEPDNSMPNLTREAAEEIKRLRHMLRRCWPAVFDWRYGPMSTVCDTKQLLIDMEEFRGKPGDDP